MPEFKSMKTSHPESVGSTRQVVLHWGGTLGITGCCMEDMAYAGFSGALTSSTATTFVTTQCPCVVKHMKLSTVASKWLFLDSTSHFSFHIHPLQVWAQSSRPAVFWVLMPTFSPDAVILIHFTSHSKLLTLAQTMAPAQHSPSMRTGSQMPTLATAIGVYVWTIFDLLSNHEWLH